MTRLARAGILIAFVVTVVSACTSAPAATGPGPSPSPSRTRPVVKPFPTVNRPCHGKVPEPFAGIATSGDFAANVASFRRATRAHVRLIEFYNPFPGTFQAGEAQQAVDLGAMPLIQLNPRQISMAQMAAGAYDSEIRAYAEQVRTFRCYVVLSFGHEMNGWWYPWGRPWTTPATFKAAWRRMVGIFRAAGARNVIWSWDPTHQYSRYQPGKTAYPAAEWFPGSKYVDWIGIDGYVGAGQNFREVFGYQLRDIRRVTRRPVYLAETGVGDGPHESRQMASLFGGLRKWRLIGLVWFDINRKNSWTLEGKPSKDAAFRRGISRFP